ncbi:YaiI/YqxD family protein [Phosphitispora sp. TUW77]|uniref:YaiI/YqxD family protein n=1 Tax=Phosphitispora sp. TUW77 TaxID=3152361 RepID=UPI003AB6B38E
MTSNSSRATHKILVDADSCPVRDIIIKIASDIKTSVVFVASISHLISCDNEYVQVITVDNIPQSADMAVINHTNAGDIVVTGDYGLASLALTRGAIPVSSRGFIFTPTNIDRLLLQRHIDTKIRRGGGRTKGPRALTEADRQNFERVLMKLLKKQARNNLDI